MTKLKRLALFLNKCYNIGRGRNPSLVPLVPKASILETYEIDLGRCQDITDKHADDFGATLCEYQKELSELFISFSE